MADDAARRHGGLTQSEAQAILLRLAGPAAAPPPPAPAPEANGAAPREPAKTPPPAAAPVAPPATADLPGLLEAVPDALVIVDQAGRIVLVNAHAERMFGYRRDELVGQAIEILVPERHRPGHVADRDGFLAAPRVRPLGVGLKLAGRRKDGGEVPVEISLSPLATAAGPLVVASVRDVTERRRAEAQLQKMEKRYRTLVEGIPAVTFMAAMDEGANELYVSPQIERLLGFGQKEWVENPILWYTQLHPDDQVRWHEEFARTVATGETFRSVYRFLARDGRVVWVHGEAQVVRDEAGRPLFLQGVAFDITGMKEAEEELRELNATLEERVGQRTEELVRSNAALARFAGTAAHDLKNPLLSIIGLVQRLERRHADQLDEKGRASLAGVLDEGRRMVRLAEDLLAYSRVRTEAQPPTPVDCAAALAAAERSLRDQVEAAGAEVAAGELPTVLADPTQLWQLFQNLIGNALKYRAARPPRVTVAARREGDGWWVVEVADNGIGIEPQYLQRIFALGVKSRLHSEAEIPGSGIGLATCETIVERHGGRIWASSDGPDRGTTISFTLPAAD
ncbi:MAG: PAS domain-containing sensor histidine kinase [Isosphaera sp.]|nr:PAS domain-containing sensor histidine kinase [Isosphaera sp.]